MDTIEFSNDPVCSNYITSWLLTQRLMWKRLTQAEFNYWQHESRQ